MNENENGCLALIVDFKTRYNDLNFIRLIRKSVTSSMDYDFLVAVFGSITSILSELTEESKIIMYLSIILILIRKNYQVIKPLSSEVAKQSLLFQKSDIKTVFDVYFRIGPLDNIQKYINSIILSTVKIFIKLDEPLDDVFNCVPNQILYHLDQCIYPLDTTLLIICRRLLQAQYIDDVNESGQEFASKLASYFISLFEGSNCRLVTVKHISLCVDIIKNYYAKSEFLRSLLLDHLSLITIQLCRHLSLFSLREQPDVASLQIVCFDLFKEIIDLIEPFGLSNILQIIGQKIINFEHYNEATHYVMTTSANKLIDETPNELWAAYIAIANFNFRTTLDYMKFFIENSHTINDRIVLNINFESSLAKSMDIWITKRVEIEGQPEEAEDIYSSEFIISFVCCFMESISEFVDLINEALMEKELFLIERELSFLITKIDSDELNEAHRYFLENIGVFKE